MLTEYSLRLQKAIVTVAGKGFHKLAREIEGAERARTDLVPDNGKQTKTAALAEAGVSTSTGSRYERGRIARLVARIGNTCFSAAN